MTMKEKDLLFTLKVILEMETKGLGFRRGIDLNQSEATNFKIENNTIYFPFTAIGGIGEKAAEKIISYRQEKGKFTNSWKGELGSFLNIGHLQKLENLEKYDLIINL